MTSPMPSVMIRRLSSMRWVMIWMPLRMMKAEAKISAPPITGAGMAAMSCGTPGTSARMIRAMPVAVPTLRAVTPVARDTPIDAE